MTRHSAGALLLVLSGMAGSAAAQTPHLVESFDPAAGELPESITLDGDGTIYLSMGSTVRRLAADGTPEVFGTLPINAFALGVKVGPDGCVYNASTSLDPSVQGAFVWRTCAAGELEQFTVLDPNGGPNDLAFARDGELYVTDPILGRIYQIDPDGSPRVWLDDPLLAGDPDNPALFFSPQGVNGIAFDKNEKHLFVGNLDHGRILKITLDRRGRPHGIEVFAESPLLRGADGIAFDEAHNLYVAVGAQDQFAKVNQHGAVSLIAHGGILHGPSSVAFGTACSDEHTLYLADLDFLRAFGFIDEPPQPNLLKFHVAVPGLPLAPLE